MKGTPNGEVNGRGKSKEGVYGNAASKVKGGI